MAARNYVPVTEPVDYTNTSGWNFPATAHVVVHTKCDAGEFMIVSYVGAPAGLFANLPNGSMILDPTNHHVYLIAGLPGSGIGGGQGTVA